MSEFAGRNIEYIRDLRDNPEFRKLFPNFKEEKIVRVHSYCLCELLHGLASFSSCHIEKLPKHIAALHVFGLSFLKKDLR